jgi:hypothetical protein
LNKYWASFELASGQARSLILSCRYSGANRRFIRLKPKARLRNKKGCARYRFLPAILRRKESGQTVKNPGQKKFYIKPGLNWVRK